jgi:hypothetical protein
MVDMIKVAAYQAPLLPIGSIEAIELIAAQVRTCEAIGVQVLCCPEGIIGGLADYAERPVEFAIDPRNRRLERLLTPIASKTSTMEKELNEAAEAGFRFQGVMGGETAIGGSEVVAVMSRGESKGRFGYRLLATSKTSTMEKELQSAADAGFEYRAQTVFKSTFGGDEVVCILERDKDGGSRGSQYKLVATSKTSTLQKELLEAGAAGYEIVGMTVAQTAMGGNELVAIARRTRVQ